LRPPRCRRIIVAIKSIPPENQGAHYIASVSNVTPKSQKRFVAQHLTGGTMPEPGHTPRRMPASESRDTSFNPALCPIDFDFTRWEAGASAVCWIGHCVRRSFLTLKGNFGAVSCVERQSYKKF